MTTDHAIMVKRLARAPIEAQSFEMCEHSGYLPLLVRNGFAGRIFCTPATRHLCKILLRDSGHLQEKEVEYANRHGFSKHRAALPRSTPRTTLSARSVISRISTSAVTTKSPAASP